MKAETGKREGEVTGEVAKYKGGKQRLEKGGEEVLRQEIKALRREAETGKGRGRSTWIGQQGIKEEFESRDCMDQEGKKKGDSGERENQRLEKRGRSSWRVKQGKRGRQRLKKRGEVPFRMKQGKRGRQRLKRGGEVPRTWRRRPGIK